jgi:FAD/FMN-containing dehydrogenase
LGWLAVGYEGTAIEVDWMLEQFAAQCQQQESVSPVVLRDADADGLWQRLTAFSFASGRDPIDLVVDVQLLPSAVAPAIDALRQAVPAISIQSHAGSGIIRAVAPAVKHDAVRSLVAQLRRRVAPYDAALVVRSAAAEAELPCNEIWGPSANGADVMERLKAEFDPAGILNPDRLDLERRPVGAS